jgi:hypothetical protein
MIVNCHIISTCLLCIALRQEWTSAADKCMRQHPHQELELGAMTDDPSQIRLTPLNASCSVDDLNVPKAAPGTSPGSVHAIHDGLKVVPAAPMHA